MKVNVHCEPTLSGWEPRASMILQDACPVCGAGVNYDTSYWDSNGDWNFIPYSCGCRTGQSVHSNGDGATIIPIEKAIDLNVELQICIPRTNFSDHREAVKQQLLALLEIINQ